MPSQVVTLASYRRESRTVRVMRALRTAVGVTRVIAIESGDLDLIPRLDRYIASFEASIEKGRCRCR